MNAAKALGRPRVLLLAGATLLAFAVSACFNPADAEPKAKSSGKGDVVASVDGMTVTRADLDQKALGRTLKQRQQIYDTEKQILDEIIEDYLLEKEAKNRGMSVADLEAKEIDAKVQPVTDADIQAWYDANKQRVRNAPLEQVQGRIKPFLENERKAQARAAFLDPLKAKATVKVSLDPPRVPVTTGNNPSMGPKGAPVTIVEFTDFQ